MMPLPIGLFAKSLLTLAAVGAVGYGGYFYREEISSFFRETIGSFSKNKSPAQPDQTKVNSLSLPDGCSLPGNGSTTCQNITPDQLKTINFYGKKETALTTEGTANANLTIEKLSGTDEFPHGFKFTFRTTDSTGITLKKDNSSFFVLKSGSDLQYKIKEEGEKWYLEKKSN